MKETVLDVLMFLLENYYGTEVKAAENKNNLREELVAVGFDDRSVLYAFDWLDALAQQRTAETNFGSPNSIRVYATEEVAVLSTDCRGFLHYLEQLGILTALSRELVIDRLLVMKDEVDLEQVKWVCLLVLANQLGEEEGALHIEDMLYAHGSFLH